MSDYWFEQAIQDILTGTNPHDVIGNSDHPDPRERWYSEALAMMLHAMESDEDPAEILISIQQLGYPTDDILHVAMLFEVILTALHAVHIVRDHGVSEASIQAGAADLIAGVEDLLRCQ